MIGYYRKHTEFGFKLRSNSLSPFAFTFAEKTLCALISDLRPAIHAWYLGSIRRAAIPGKMGDIFSQQSFNCVSLNPFLELLKEGEKEITF